LTIGSLGTTPLPLYLFDYGGCQMAAP